MSSPFIWGFPKIRGTFLGVPIIRTIVYWGLYWGTLILGNYHMSFIILYVLEGCVGCMLSARRNFFSPI